MKLIPQSDQPTPLLQRAGEYILLILVLPKITKEQMYLAILCFIACISLYGMSIKPKQGIPEVRIVQGEVQVIRDTIYREMIAHEIAHAPAKEIANPTKFAYWMWYLKAREGYIKEEYYCPAGVLTIGYGHNVEAHGVPEEVEDGILDYHGASKVLYEDMQKHYNEVMKHFPHLNPDQGRAVASLTANCGIAKIMYTRGKKKNGYSAFWKALKAHKSPNFKVYCKYKTPEGRIVTSKNLQSARNFEQALFDNKDFITIWTGRKWWSGSMKQVGEFYRQVILRRDILANK